MNDTFAIISSIENGRSTCVSARRKVIEWHARMRARLELVKISLDGRTGECLREEAKN